MSTRTRLTIVTTLSLVFLLSACGSPNPQPVELTPIPTLASAETPTLIPVLQATSIATGAPVTVSAGKADAALGAPIYLENCSPCHGNQGQGVDAPALRNSQYIQTAGDQAIIDTIANGRSGTAMPAWLQANGGSLTDTEIANVAAYLYTLQGVSPLPSATPMPTELAETPLAPGASTPEPARPSNPGNLGPAASMPGDMNRGMSAFGLYCAACHGPEGVQGIPNPGSDDGSVPVLNPIDPTIADLDPKIFAANVDLFIEHGSVPAGPGPLLVMPPFGDSQMLTEQQIADLIAYIVHLNEADETK